MRNSPRETVEDTPGWSGLEEAHWTPKDGQSHSLVQLAGSLRVDNGFAH